MKYRLNKYIAHSGICSRRKAGDLVKDGFIKVNGEIEKNPAIEVDETDEIEYMGKPIRIVTKKIYLLLNKPKNVITTMSDEKGRKTVWDIVQSKVKTKIYPVGRLDRNTTGLILLTNDGELSQHLSHPKTKVKKIYQVSLDKPLLEEDLVKLQKGFALDDGYSKFDVISFIDGEPQNTVGVQLHSGKNRIIRRMFEHIGYEVETLDRVYFAGLTKKDIPRGWSRFLKTKEIIMLKHFIK
jgi:23S rRNA pseudouridine2605 synthase